MAKNIITTTEFTDDLTGGRAEGTVLFSWDGVAYEIDLSKANTKAFAKELAPYIAAARPVRASRSRGASRRSTTKTSNLDLGAVRAWAAENGHSVSTRGRIAAPVLEAYEAAH